MVEMHVWFWTICPLWTASFRKNGLESYSSLCKTCCSWNRKQMRDLKEIIVRSERQRVVFVFTFWLFFHSFASFLSLLRFNQWKWFWDSCLLLLYFSFCLSLHILLFLFLICLILCCCSFKVEHSFYNVSHMSLRKRTWTRVCVHGFAHILMFS